MRLIFLGDISVDQLYHLPSDAFPDFQAADLVVANLEGLLVPEPHLDLVARAAPLVFHNSPDVLALLDAFNVQVVCLANNHMFDVPLPISITKQLLSDANIGSFGASASLAEAGSPFVFSRDGTTVKLYGFGWDVIGCELATDRRQGVNPLEAGYLLDTIRRVREVDQTSCVVFIMHWNYEYELYPQPAHRQLAHDLIRLGADAVIGMHPHRVQGVEQVDGKPIVYSLGNWFFPDRQVGNVVWSSPPEAACELALTLEIDGRQVKSTQFDWYRFDSALNQLHHQQSEGWDGATLQGLTPYVGMSHQEFRRWFRANRERRRGLPIYKEYRHTTLNRLKDLYILSRQKLIEMLVRAGLKGGR
jgi:hypothetical protein